MTPLLEGLLAGYGIAIPVGAIAILIVNASLRCGFQAGWMAGAGAASADLFYAAVASVAGSALIKLLQPVAGPVRVISGLALILMAAYALWRQRQPVTTDGPVTAACQPWRLYGQFLGLTLINPLTVVYFTAFILGRAPATAPTPAARLIFILGAGAASLSWQTVLAAVGGFARARLSTRFQSAATLMGNLLVLTLGLRILLSAL